MTDTTVEQLVQWWNRQAPNGLMQELNLLAVLRQVAEDILANEANEETASAIALEVIAILREDKGQRQIVEFCPCGHTEWRTVPMIVAAGGFRQLLDIFQGRRASAPTFHDSKCCQCEADFEYNEARLAAALDGWE